MALNPARWFYDFSLAKRLACSPPRCSRLASAGCRVARPGIYPIGLYSVGSETNLAEIAEAGFSLVAGPAQRGFLDEAKANGIGVMASPGSSAGENFDAAKVRSTVAKLDRHPALWSWYLIDEPDMHSVSPEKVEEAHRFVKRLGATKQTSLVLYQGDLRQVVRRHCGHYDDRPLPGAVAAVGQFSLSTFTRHAWRPMRSGR